MDTSAIAAYVFCFLTLTVIGFQLALAMGAPWGEMAMGGKYPGRFPTKLRIAAGVQVLLLGLMALTIQTRASLCFIEYSSACRIPAWVIASFFLLGTFLNLITPSKKERLLWAPVSFGLLLSATIVAAS